MISRLIYPQITSKLFQGKVIVVYGARQVGKTTLIKQLINDYQWKSLYINCDLIPNQQLLDYQHPQWFIDAVMDIDFIVLDEAQNIPQIGMILKILVDQFPKKQFIATWSSSFDLANKLNEPLTGRNYKFTLYGLSCEELKQHYDAFWIQNNLESLLIYGSYPDVITHSSEQKREILDLLAGDYLYKDIFKFDGIKKSTIIKQLLQLLALQLGNEVNYYELAQKLGVNHLTVGKYIDILEQAFIIFKLPSFARNLRNEISKWVKIYFYDLWVRNSLIQNYNSLNLRTDTWALWENFLIIERLKYQSYHWWYANRYFRRTYDQKEIDYIEEYDGTLHTYEFKRSKQSISQPTIFLKSYPNSTFTWINQQNYLWFIS
jgi:uncharacterized protein